MPLPDSFWDPEPGPEPEPKEMDWAAIIEKAKAMATVPRDWGRHRSASLNLQNMPPRRNNNHDPSTDEASADPFANFNPVAFAAFDYSELAYDPELEYTTSSTATTAPLTFESLEAAIKSTTLKARTKPRE